MSDPGVVMLATLTIAGTVSTVWIIANTVIRHREQTRRIAEAGASSVSDERIMRIEAAVESIAIEVERISEGQRFTTRLLSEQTAPVQALMPRPAKFDTPH